MATSSILKNVTIRDKRSAARLVGAIEKSEKTAVLPVRMSKKVREATEEDLKAIFRD
jgi:hypothetical protein